MKQNEDINDLLARHFSNESLTAGQRQELEAWIRHNRSEYERLKKFTDRMAVLPEQVHFDADQAWEKIEPRLTANLIPFKRKKHFLTYASVAASLLILLSVATVWLIQRTDPDPLLYANHTQTARHILLPDSSEVILYPQAQINFKATRETRLARLEGKAFFQVRKAAGKPFKVETRHLNVEVLGTSFLINAEKIQQTGVFVKTGKVKVTTDNSGVILQANEKAELKNGKLQSGNIQDPSAVFGEKKQPLIFNQTPLANVIKEVEKQTGIQIELGKGFDSHKITTRIDPDDASGIAAELAFLCGCKCDTLTPGKHYRLYYE